MDFSHEGFQPLNDRVLVRRIEDAPVSKLVWTPDIAQARSKRGIVVAVGPGKLLNNGERQPMQVKEGDEIFFGRYTDYEDDHMLYVLIQEGDVVGIVDKG